MLLFLKDGSDFDFELKNGDDIFYLLEPKDHVVLRNAIEPIIYQFV
jgi:hypothetical protein